MTDASKSVREFIEKYPPPWTRGHLETTSLITLGDIADVLNALPALLAQLDEAKARVARLEAGLERQMKVSGNCLIVIGLLGMDASTTVEQAHEKVTSVLADLATLTRQRDGLVEAVEEVASKSTCECWDVPAMGSGLPYRWKGCKVHHSTDPEEWCLCCVAHAALVAARKEQG